MAHCSKGHALFEGQTVCPTCFQLQQQAKLEAERKRRSGQQVKSGCGCLLLLPILGLALSAAALLAYLR
jgi:hypothetical protein